MDVDRLKNRGGDSWAMASVREAAYATWGINCRQSVLRRRGKWAFSKIVQLRARLR